MVKFYVFLFYLFHFLDLGSWLLPLLRHTASWPSSAEAAAAASLLSDAFDTPGARACLAQRPSLAAEVLTCLHGVMIR
jgi:hypothetical protein